MEIFRGIWAQQSATSSRLLDASTASRTFMLFRDACHAFNAFSVSRICLAFQPSRLFHVFQGFLVQNRNKNEQNKS